MQVQVFRRALLASAISDTGVAACVRPVDAGDVDDLVMDLEATVVDPVDVRDGTAVADAGERDTCVLLHVALWHLPHLHRRQHCNSVTDRQSVMWSPTGTALSSLAVNRPVAIAPDKIAATAY